MDRLKQKKPVRRANFCGINIWDGNGEQLLLYEEDDSGGHPGLVPLTKEWWIVVGCVALFAVEIISDVEILSGLFSALLTAFNVVSPLNARILLETGKVSC